MLNAEKIMKIYSFKLTEQALELSLLSTTNPMPSRMPKRGLYGLFSKGASKMGYFFK